MNSVEKTFLDGEKLLRYDGEKIATIVVRNSSQLGKLTALRFLEWIHANPEGVVCLPTGKSPLVFINETCKLLASWNEKETQKELQQYGIAPKKPSLRGMHFVQIDEFYPINSSQTNSFLYFIRKHYFDRLGFSPERALTIDGSLIGLKEHETLESIWHNTPVDLSLRYRHATSRLEQRQKDLITAVDEWCMAYEEKIRSLNGGISFFLGGIGPDGHVAFNMQGSSFFSTTRLCPLNYESKAAAANDLGGIETAHRCHAITIGIDTIRHNPHVVPIIIAAGAAKASQVADAILKERSIQYPASFLHDLPAARFYLTEGSAELLIPRQILHIEQSEEIGESDLEKIVVDTALVQKKTIASLTSKDFSVSPYGKLLKAKNISIEKLLKKTEASLIQKLKNGMFPQKETCFLHSEPHHDDIMLGYLPYVVRNLREHSNAHHFATVTYGFRAVTNSYMLKLCQELQKELYANDAATIQKYLSGDYSEEERMNAEVLDYLDGLASYSEEKKKTALHSRLFSILSDVFEEKTQAGISDRLEELINYFSTQYPGKKDLPHIQEIKGRCRELESACLWGYFGFDHSSLTHMNMQFTSTDQANRTALYEKNVTAILALLNRIAPQTITLAFDPEESGPAAHFETLKVFAGAIERFAEKNEHANLRILGYRNVWFQFHPSEVNIFVPVSLNMFALQHTAFMSSYLSQKDASFPSPRYQGPFSLATQKVQVGQYDAIKTCLGEDYFFTHPSALIRATRGLVFLKSMDVPTFLDEVYAMSKRLNK